MEKFCQTCGVEGFSRPLIYCTECWDTVAHKYCLGLSSNDIPEDFSWMCDSCKSADKSLAKLIVFGNNPSNLANMSGYGPLRISSLDPCNASGVPVVGPIWRGGFDIIGRFHGSFREMEAFMPKTSYSKAVKIIQSMTKASLCFHMKKRRDVWPKNFDNIGDADSNIGLYILPEFSRWETEYNSLVEYMISNDFAMTANVAGIELTVFTSLEISSLKKHEIQGKYYLWGTLKEKKSRLVCFKPPSAAKKRTVKGVREVDRPDEQTGTKSKHKGKHRKRKYLASLLQCSPVPSLRPEWKRVRSKRGKERNAQQNNENLSQEDILFECQVQVASENILSMTASAVGDQGIERNAQQNNENLSQEDILFECQVQDASEILTPKNSTENILSKTASALGDQGLAQPPSLEDEPKKFIDNDSCSTSVLDLDEENSVASISSTVVIEFDDKEYVCGSMRGNETSEKSIPSSIFKITGDFSEITSSEMKQVGRYQIKSDLAPILSKILERYGDIVSECTCEPTVILEAICKVVQDLESLRLSGLRFHHVSLLKSVVQVAENCGIDVKWLCQRCNDLEKLTSHLSQYPAVKGELSQCKRKIQLKEESLSFKRAMVEKHQAELKSMEEEFESMKEYTERLEVVVESLKSISESFCGKSVVDGLL